MKKNNVLTIESTIPVNDCNKDNYFFDWQQGINYLVLED